jgi:hypothetical protein
MEIAQVRQIRLPRKRLRTVLWVIFPGLIVLYLFLMMSEILPNIIGNLLLPLALVDLIILYIIAEKYYNWPIIFFFIFFDGILFKRQHWPFANFISTLGIFMISIGSLANSIRFLITLRNNTFLKWFGSVSGLIITLYMLGWVFMFQGWSREIGDVFAYSGAILFIISILGMVFTLPGSNYISWTEVERKSFFRAVLIPMVIVFALIMITIVFEDAYKKLLDFDTARWHRNGLELFNLEGIPKI